jgi:hypothetical protein
MVGLICRSTGPYLDFDLRPSGRGRGDLRYFVSRCPACGYCSGDIGEASEAVKRVIVGKAYRRQLTAPGFSDLAISFLCKALTLEGEKDVLAAARALLCAAWQCDDENRPEKAAECRHRAADMLLKAEEKGCHIHEHRGLNALVLVDLLRRSGRFEDALAVIEARVTELDEAILVRILEHQIGLIRSRDVACHSLSALFIKDRSARPAYIQDQVLLAVFGDLKPRDDRPKFLGSLRALTRLIREVIRL